MDKKHKTKEQAKNSPRSTLKKGETPKARFELHRKNVLRWVYHWGATPLSLAISISSRKAVDSLIKKGFLVKRMSDSGIPRHFVCLTSLGVEFTEASIVMDTHPYRETDAQNVNQSQFSHDVFTQSIVRHLIDYKVVNAFWSPKGIARNIGTNARSNKVPDAIVQGRKSLENIAIEVEFKQKWAEQLHNFIARIVKKLNGEREDGDTSLEIQRFVVFFNSMSAMKNYSKLLETGLVALYIRGSANKWKFLHNVNIPNEIKAKIDFVYVPYDEIEKILTSGKPTGSILRWLEEQSEHPW